MKGNYRKATEKYINLLLETLEVDPEKYGYEFGRWTTARLATYSKFHVNVVHYIQYISRKNESLFA
ncbi:hypothetical protein QUA57_24385, partial [Microcoleus sp. Pol7_B2]